MPQKLLLLVLSTVLFASACAENSSSETRHFTETTLKVDLDAVVRVGNVVPVAGITAAGQPDAAALKVFADKGYTTVIDLRTDSEDRGMDEVAVVSNLNMKYIVLPIDKPEDISFDNAMALGKLIDDANGPVLVHCASSNRVGALLALRESLNGADDATALEYGKEAGMTRLEGRVKEVLSKQKQ